jgi:transposase
MQRVEARYGRYLRDLLTEWYVDEGLTLHQIGDRLGITKGAVSRWIDPFSIDTRPGGRRTAA